MQRIAHILRQLQWKLTFSYALITIVAVILIELLTIVLVFGYFFFNQSSVLASSVQAQATQAVPYFVHTPPDRAVVTKWLQITSKATPGSSSLSQRGFLCVVDGQGRVVAALGKDAPPVDNALQSHIPAAAAAPLQAILQGKRAVFTLQDTNGMLLIVAPIQEEQQQPVGALVTETPPLSAADAIASPGRLVPIALLNGLLLTILVGIMSCIFGFWTARGFTRRFKSLSSAADHWSRGDFSVLAQDTSKDEVGQLFRRLNLMAEQLQRHLQALQQLAILEERNRLARDLHDSVKQQLFSVLMQVGTLRVLMKRDGEKAQQRLNQMEGTLQNAQQELTTLIHELRPAALHGRALDVAIRELVAQWQSQTSIATEVEVAGMCNPSPMVEDALFRLTQEALSNVARHSHATKVCITLRCEGEMVTLLLSDNGQGCAVAVAEGRGVGLSSMQERVQALNGTITFLSEVGKGTLIRVHCPMHAGLALTVPELHQE